tara:strand:+ start:49312 stop:51309 length:1998 start_codon:yes stop_codon:yes gene_type:complete
LQYNRLIATAALLAFAASTPALAQQTEKPSASGSVRVTPSELTIPVGGTAQLAGEILDVGGRPAEGSLMYISRNRRAVRVSRTGEVTATKPGKYEVLVRAVLASGRGPEATVVVTVPHPEPAAIKVHNAPTKLYVGTTVRITGAVVDKDDVVRKDLAVAFASSDTDTFAIDGFGYVTASKTGTGTLRASGGGLSSEHAIEVLPNPVRSITVATPNDTIRTGDVVRFDAKLLGDNGTALRGVPVFYTVTATPDDTLGNAATGQIMQDGRFVAEKPGLYTVVATCGNASGRKTIRCNERFEQKRKLKKIGHGAVLDVHTSDLWVWEGVDGRDYCVTGTWGANGDAIFWDVTDPARIERIATVTVDARTVNDVKVSEDGRLCIISREGASNRKNGIVAFDVTNPRKPERITEFNDELTGGVHNLFIDKGYAYALSAGRRYDILDIKNPRAPTRVGSYQIFEPGASIHDVWVEDGIAYSANWRYGLHLVDVGNGIKGGSPSNPVKIGNYAYPSGWNHAVFPWRSKDTGKFYVIGGDEAFPHGLFTKDHPTYARGWIHFVDFTDLDNPQEVARYEVPEAGTHNLWMEDNLMYVAYYNGGLRVVDVSGELMGDLYQQGREIAWFLPTHPKGVVPNASMVWGPQPYKGKIFFSDWNSGLWCVELIEDNGRRR